MFKECLRNNIMPFIILDDHKSCYLRGLKEYENDKMFLVDTIKNEQDLYENFCNDLLNFEIKDIKLKTINTIDNRICIGSFFFKLMI